MSFPAPGSFTSGHVLSRSRIVYFWPCPFPVSFREKTGRNLIVGGWVGGWVGFIFRISRCETPGAKKWCILGKPPDCFPSSLSPYPEPLFPTRTLSPPLFHNLHLRTHELIHMNLRLRRARDERTRGRCTGDSRGAGQKHSLRCATSRAHVRCTHAHRHHARSRAHRWMRETLTNTHTPHTATPHTHTHTGTTHARARMHAQLK